MLPLWPRAAISRFQQTHAVRGGGLGISILFTVIGSSLTLLHDGLKWACGDSPAMWCPDGTSLWIE